MIGEVGMEAAQGLAHPPGLADRDVVVGVAVQDIHPATSKVPHQGERIAGIGSRATSCSSVLACSRPRSAYDHMLIHPGVGATAANRSGKVTPTCQAPCPPHRVSGQISSAGICLELSCARSRTSSTSRRPQSSQSNP